MLQKSPCTPTLVNTKYSQRGIGTYYVVICTNFQMVAKHVIHAMTKMFSNWYIYIYISLRMIISSNWDIAALCCLVRGMPSKVLVKKTGVQKLLTDISSWHILVHNWWSTTITSVIDHATSFKRSCILARYNVLWNHIRVWIYSTRTALRLNSKTNNDIDMIILNIGDMITWTLFLHSEV